ncbi:hypothetical protein AAUPMC_15450, partial [Pasteurella multocida subsp. multocida str. Anand1_cattle]
MLVKKINLMESIMKIAIPEIKAFFDEPTNTYSYVVHDPDTQACAIID